MSARVNTNIRIQCSQQQVSGMLSKIDADGLVSHMKAALFLNGI